MADQIELLGIRTRRLETDEDEQSGNGAPAHIAADGTKYWDYTNAAWYINDSGIGTFGNSWQHIGGGGIAVPHQLLDNPWHTDTDTLAPLEGALVIGNATPRWNRLVHPGGAGYALVSTVATFGWDNTPTWTGRHTLAAGAHILDDQTLIFGTDSDGTIEYDEDGTDQVRVAGAEWMFEPLVNFDAGITFTGASGANVVTVPDNVAQALNLVDAGAREFLRIVSTNGSQAVVLNEVGADNDFRVEATGHADALEVRGSDGQITLGALGAGFVQADAGGVLSSAAIAAGDLPAHTHSGAGQGGSLAMGTTDTDATAGSVLFAGVAGVIQEDNASLFFDDTNNTLGIRDNAPHANADGLYVPWISGDTQATSIFGSSNASNDQTAIVASSYDSTAISAQSQSSTAIFGETNSGTATDFGVRAWASGAGCGLNAKSGTGTALLVTLTGVGTAIADFQDNGTPVLTIQDGGQADFAEYIRHLNDVGNNTHIRFQEDQFTVTCGGVTMIDAVEAGTDYLALHDGLNFVGDTSNAFSTVGLTINQGSADNESLTLKSSDIAHGMTDRTETDSWLTHKKVSEPSGGALINGFSAATVGVLIGGAAVTDNTAISTSAKGYVELRAYKKSGTGVGAAGAGANIVVFRNYATSRFLFQEDGTAYADVAWATFSDKRLKRNIEPMQYGLTEVLKLNPVSYMRTDGERQLIGLLAQDVHRIIPEVTRRPPNEDSYWSMDYNALVPVLVRAIQELEQKIERLENGI